MFFCYKRHTVIYFSSKMRITSFQAKFRCLSENPDPSRTTLMILCKESKYVTLIFPSLPLFLLRYHRVPSRDGTYVLRPSTYYKFYWDPNKTHVTYCGMFFSCQFIKIEFHLVTGKKCTSFLGSNTTLLSLQVFYRIRAQKTVQTLECFATNCLRMPSAKRALLVNDHLW